MDRKSVNQDWDKLLVALGIHEAMFECLFTEDLKQTSNPCMKKEKPRLLLSRKYQVNSANTHFYNAHLL